MNITSMTQLENVLKERSEKALNDTTEHFFNQLLELIDNKIYDRPSTWGGRTKEFRQSWEKTKAELKGMILETMIYQDPLVMKYVADEFKHGNIYEPLTGHALAEIWNNGTERSAFGFPTVPDTHFWDEFVKKVETNLWEVFKMYCKKHGVQAV